MGNKLFVVNISLELNLFLSPTAPWDLMIKVKEQRKERTRIEQKKEKGKGRFLTCSF